jgi:hypothetical protein
MLAIITKADDDYWYEFKEIKSIEDLFKIYFRVVVEENDLDERLVTHWEGFKKEDIPLLKEAKAHVTIYNTWIE